MVRELGIGRLGVGWGLSIITWFSKMFIIGGFCEIDFFKEAGISMVGFFCFLI